MTRQPPKSRARAPFALLIAILGGTSLVGCSDAPAAHAERIASRARLIGGPRALGEVGDWLLENDKIRVIVQDQGFSRGFGVYGGALIDADRQRADAPGGTSAGGRGRDNFGELFPIFFLEALEPRPMDDPNNPGTALPAVAMESAGGPGEDAVLVVRGSGGDFIALTQVVNETLLGDDRNNPSLFFETRYILHPGVSYVEMDTLVRNISFPGRTIELPATSFNGEELPAPFGDVLLFGGGNKVFLPHRAGFDLRFALEREYASRRYTLPALAGIIGDFIASTSDDVSYGLIAFPPSETDAANGVQNYAYAHRDQFVGATPRSLHVPFIASAFTGVLQVAAAPRLLPNDFAVGGADEMHFRRAFMIGSGDVASISDQAFALMGQTTGKLEGVVRERQGGRPAARAQVVVLRSAASDSAKVTSCATDADGHFRANLPAGDYVLALVKAGVRVATPTPVHIDADATTAVALEMDAPAELIVTAVEPGVGPVPAKATLVGTIAPSDAGRDTKDFLFDQSLGESYRYSDLILDDPADPQTRRFIEAITYDGNGVMRLVARPGRYTLVVGRGIEYDRAEVEVELRAGEQVAQAVTLHRVVDTTGYLAADFHLHSQYSLDSGARVADRLISYAGEGVELAVSTDHNFVVDYQPVLAQERLERFMNSAIGLELTTIDRGHFNGFPLERQSGALDDGNIASVTFGSFAWAFRTPGEIFSDLRQLGRHDSSGALLPIVVQVNHPRDSILGYFDQYGVNSETFEVEGQTGLLAPDPELHPEFSADAFSFGFDALEVFNGKRIQFLRTYRYPDTTPTLALDGGPKGTRTIHVDPVSCCEVQVGDPVRDLPPIQCSDAEAPCTCNVAAYEKQTRLGRCALGGEIAFPGVVEDWMQLLAMGKRVTGTANSDSHEPEKEEPGSPRTYIRVPSDEPSALTADQIVDAFTRMDALMTNGPFVRVDVNGTPMGGIAPVAGGRATVHVSVDTAPWVHVDTLRTYVSGVLVDTRPIDASVEPAGPFEADVAIDVPVDGFVNVEVTGTDSLFPSLFPNEVPPTQFSDVLGTIGSSFGFGTDASALSPALVNVATPYALTNPIYLDADGDGLIRPSRPLPGTARSAAHAAASTAPTQDLGREVVTVPTADEAARAAWAKIPLRKRLALARLPRWMWPTDDPRDVRRVFLQFVGHADP